VSADTAGETGLIASDEGVGVVERTVVDEVHVACSSTGCLALANDLRGQRRLAAIARAASSVADAGSLSVTLDVVAREVLQAERIAAVQILLVENGTMHVVGKAGFTDAEDFTERLEACRQLGARLYFLEAFATHKRIVVPHRKASVLADPRWEPLHAIMGAPDWDAFVALPLVVRGRALGVMNAFCASGDIPSAQDLEFLEAMADQAATAVDSADLLARSRRDATLAERARLARELHDSVVQQVFSIRMHAKALRAQVEPGGTSTPERVRAVADELLDLAQDALADLRGLVLQLHPVELAGRGLSAALATHAESVRAASGLEVELDDDAEALAQLPAGLQEDLYRIVQEALHNVVKHAGASRALVRIQCGPGRVVAEVSDDGCGLPEQRSRAGLGMVSMRERAQRWGGSMELGRGPWGGCAVTVCLPWGGGR
jgi:signal transduction histidine kinase